MNIHITGRQVELTPDIRAAAGKKLKSLERLLGSVREVDLIFSVEKYRHKVEIHVIAKGASLVIIEEAPEVMSALNLAFENLTKKLKKDKEKFREKRRRKSREQKTLAAPVDTSESGRRIIRSRDYSVKPLSIDEALIQFDAEKKDIFVFRKTGSDKFGVIYRRKDGHIGVIEPE